MKYIITGKNVKTGEMVSPGLFTQVLEKGIILNLEAYNKLGYKNKITPNGTAKSRTGVAIVDEESTSNVDKLLQSSPAWSRVQWNVSPLENF